MKNITLIFLVFLVTSCKKDKPLQEHYYKAINGEDVGLLRLTIVEKRFFGHYEVHYGQSGKDVGEVEGSVYGDTLKGKYRYYSFGGSDKVAPFLLLKHGNVLKLGSGAITSYMNIPLFISETVQFKDEDFEFHRIDKKSAEEFNLVTK